MDDIERRKEISFFDFDKNLYLRIKIIFKYSITAYFCCRAMMAGGKTEYIYYFYI